jgi:hypothetical protein
MAFADPWPRVQTEGGIAGIWMMTIFRAATFKAHRARSRRTAVVFSETVRMVVTPSHSLAKLCDQFRPQMPDPVTVVDGRMDHDRLRSWVDADALPLVSDKRELAARSR